MSVTTQTQPFRLFRVRLAARQRRSPHLVRLTFADPTLADFADNGYDQRLKVVLPQDGGLPLAEFPMGDDWFTVWRGQPTDRRAHIRTYTIVAVRPGAGEIDVDFVDHGATGPGSRFGGAAPIGEEAIILGPSASYDGTHGGLEFRREFAGSARQLIVGDLSALPAIAGIARELPSTATGLISIEVPHAEDAHGVEAPAGVKLDWCIASAGDDQMGTVRRWLTGLGPLHGDQVRTTVIDDGGEDPYWEVTAPGADAATPPAISAWIAGESGRVRALRRMLVDDFDVPRAAVCFMGYWRDGVAGG
ncbi:siderophore-interacting protein [Flexivirga sp. ID2601S]|uniref:Siderophore-interacting protein n=1 Tax=Flexivirga aerilata TaxID=1656889 RepID=A0A849AF05_9MICO|nr:siderophore-interacting protein [Flexivirga aerilata]NNG37758.1 siderophore-interacting protein [Flexivirga aerilata]